MILPARQTNDRVQKACYYDRHLEKKITEGNMREKVHNNRSMTTVYDFVKMSFVCLMSTNITYMLLITFLNIGKIKCSSILY